MRWISLRFSAETLTVCRVCTDRGEHASGHNVVVEGDRIVAGSGDQLCSDLADELNAGASNTRHGIAGSQATLTFQNTDHRRKLRAAFKALSRGRRPTNPSAHHNPFIHRRRDVRHSFVGPITLFAIVWI